MHLLHLMIEYKKPLAGLTLGLTAGFSPAPEEVEIWVNIIVKIIGGIAAIYTIYELRRKSKNDAKTDK